MASHLYETLNLGMSATPDEIRKAYKKLALKTHPDRAPPERKQEAEEEFRKVNAAYEVLIDEEKRRIYDRHGVYPPPEPAAENVYSNPYSPPSPPPRYQPPPNLSRPSFERHSRRHAPRPDPFHQMFNETPFPSTAPPGSGPFGMHPMFNFTDPFKIFHDVFASAIPPHHMHSRFQPMHPIIGGHDLFLEPDRIQPFRPSDPNVIWTEETRTTKIVNGHHQTIHTLVDKDGNVRRSYDIDGKRWETFNDHIVQPYETIHDAHHERIDYAPPPPSSHGRSRKSSSGRKGRHASPGYPYVSASPQPTVPPTHHVRTKSQHIPTRHAYRRMYSYSEEDLGSPISDTENVRPYSYEFAPAATPRYEEYHYPTAPPEHRPKRHYEHAAPPTPPRDEPGHRRAMRPETMSQPVYADHEPSSFIHPNPEHEVKEKRWWHRFKA